MPSARARSSVTAVAGAVVSKPIAKKTTSRSGLRARELERVERRVDHAHVGAARLRLEQRAAPAGHAHHVAEGREDHLRPLGERDRVVDAAHRDHADRAAGPVHEVDLGRDQILEPVLVDRVRVPAADLHDLAPSRPGSTSAGELARELLRQLAGAELVDVLHGERFSSAMPAWQSSSVARRDRRDELDRDALARRRRPRRSPSRPSTATTRAVDGHVAAGDAALRRRRQPTALSRSSRSSCS